MSDTYTTISGDMWDIIAYKKYGSEKYMPDLIAANYQYADIVTFPAGVVLTLPEIDTAEKALTPPWGDA